MGVGVSESAFFKMARGFVFAASIMGSMTAICAPSDYCSKVVFSVIDPRNNKDLRDRNYYLTASSTDLRVFLRRDFVNNPMPLTDSLLWEIRQTYPVPTDKDPRQPAWINIFLLPDESSSASQGRKFRNLFLYYSVESQRVNRSLVLYPAQLGYYAVSGARIDFESANSIMSRVYLVLRESKLYIVPNWTSDDGKEVSVALSYSPGDFPGWVALSGKDKSLSNKHSSDCTRYLIKKYGIKMSGK